MVITIPGIEVSKSVKLKTLEQAKVALGYFKKKGYSFDNENSEDLVKYSLGKEDLVVLYATNLKTLYFDVVPDNEDSLSATIIEFLNINSYKQFEQMMHEEVQQKNSKQLGKVFNKLNL